MVFYALYINQYYKYVGLIHNFKSHESLFYKCGLRWCCLANMLSAQFLPRFSGSIQYYFFIFFNCDNKKISMEKQINQILLLHSPMTCLRINMSFIFFFFFLKFHNRILF